MESSTPTPPSRRRKRSRRGARRRRRNTRRLLQAAFWLLLIAALGAGGLYLWKQGLVPANQAAEDWYEVEARSEVLVQLPRDDAPHESYMEWWYYNGHLVTEGGDRYSFHFSIFVINALATHTVAHASFVDQQTGRHYASQKRTTGNPSRGVENGFDFELGDWRMTGRDGNDRLRASGDDFTFNLHLSGATAPVMQGGTGLLDFELAGKSYYYSRPRMQISGAVKVGSEIRNVTGMGWFDHQWGDFEVNQLGWDWFAIQLDDGSDIMIYQLFDSSGLPVLGSGTHTRDGLTSVLTAEDFEVTVTDHWVSERTGIRYPMGWLMEIPGQSVSLRVAPVIRNSEFDGRVTSYMVYWEGAVDISGTQQGRGFVELSGYNRIQREQRAARPQPQPPADIE